MREILAYPWWYHPWADGHGLYKKGYWTRHSDQASNPYLSMASGSVTPSACPVWLPVLTSFGDELWWGGVSHIKPFLPRLLWWWCFSTAVATLTKTFGHWVLVLVSYYKTQWAWPLDLHSLLPVLPGHCCVFPLWDPHPNGHLSWCSKTALCRGGTDRLILESKLWAK